MTNRKTLPLLLVMLLSAHGALAADAPVAVVSAPSAPSMPLVAPANAPVVVAPAVASQAAIAVPLAPSATSTLTPAALSAPAGWLSGMWCGNSHDIGGGKGGPAESAGAKTVLCQGADPKTSCPSGFTKTMYSMDTRHESNNTDFYTCIKD